MADRPSKKTKRRIKDPETFRERAAKTGESNPPKQRKLASVKESEDKNANPLTRFLVPSFFRNSWSELKLVSWPTRTQSFRLTFAVLVFAIIFGLSIAGIDWVIDRIFRQLLLT